MNRESGGWHCQSTAEIARALACDPESGLAGVEALRRLGCHGPNRLRESLPRPAWLKFLDQFKNLLVIILIGAAFLAGAIGDLKDAAVIVIVVLLNAALGYYQEHRAEATLAALRQMLAQQARVRRDGQVLEIAAESLVPGDLVLLAAGDRVPADARVVVAHGAEVSEAALTGESQAAEKQADRILAADCPLAERNNMVFMNTVVTRGRLETLVCATGMATEMGRITGLLETADSTPAPLQIQIDTLGKRLAVLAGVIVAVIFVLGILRGLPLADSVLTSIALAVAAIPEGLPAVVTVTLAIGMYRMARNRAIVKKLSAVETLGSTSVICSDKTGTLTLNQMTARRLYCFGQRLSVSGSGYSADGAILGADKVGADLRLLLTAAALCSDSRLDNDALIGDPTEGALLALAAKEGVDAGSLAAEFPRLAEIPFDSTSRFMATFHRQGEQVRMWIKGAPDVLIARASRYHGAGGELPLDEAARARFASENESLAGEAMRVLALAERVIPARDFTPASDLEIWAKDWGLIGLVGIVDPPRPEAAAAIRDCKLAGIEVKMITGDHPLTAAAIAHELGLDGAVLSGSQIERMDASELEQQVAQTTVFARVAPEHKLRIVSALKAAGHIVAMTGDGVNDAPALKSADIGVAMGASGTEVARQAATMVLTDDNFATIVHAVEEGRIIYDNIVKFVRFQLSTNIGAILTVLVATLLGWPVPFTAIHLLWINIIMDGPPAMTLGLEAARPGLMREAPRSPSARILTAPRVARLALYGVTMTTGTLLMFRHGLLAHDPQYALTLAFTTFVLFQFFNVFNARSEYGSAFGPGFLSNPRLWLTLLFTLLLQLVVVYWEPAQAIFDTVALDADDWLIATAVASSVLLLDELRKLGGRLLAQH